MRPVITVAIPVLDAGQMFERVLLGVTGQRVASEIELVVCDSGSRDGTPGLARAHGATVITIDRREFSHGATRNLLMERSHGDHVAFLTQDAEPTDTDWLSRLRAGFELACDVGLAFGPYRPRPDASPMVARELTAWFASFAPDGQPRLDRICADEPPPTNAELLGPRGFFTDANGCVARAAWEQVPFRRIPYAEDHALAHDMLRAGFSKAYLPDADVVHSHEYSIAEWLRRSYDETRALHELYGYVEPVAPRRAALKLWGLVGADWRWAATTGRRTAGLPARSASYHAARMAGAALGSRAERLPAGVLRALTLERS